MAATGKKINELNSISSVTDETVFPAVYVSGSTVNGTANKVSVEQLKTNLQNDFYTESETNILLNQKQDKLTAGENITITQESDETVIISSIVPSTVIQSNVVNSIVLLTQSEYDSLVESGEIVTTTLYLIKEESES